MNGGPKGGKGGEAGDRGFRLRDPCASAPLETRQTSDQRDGQSMMIVTRGLSFSSGA